MTRRLAPVTSEAQNLLQTALALPAGDRAELAAVLLESLESDPETDDLVESDPDADEHVFSEAWLAEIETRARRALSESPGTDRSWEDVHAEITARLRSR